MPGPFPSNDLNAFRSVLAASRNIIVVAGAGLSAASGIPTFRGAGGMWRKYDAISLATPQAFEDQPSTVWQFYHMRRERVMKCNPNAAHLALARFSLPSVRHLIAPGSKFTLITQNVDGLSKRALDSVAPHDSLVPPPESGDEAATLLRGTDQPILVEMHGRVLDITCTSCDHRESSNRSPICSALAGTEELTEAGITEPMIPVAALPRCSACGSLARPGVVWFEEVPYGLDIIDKLVQEADLCIVVGTSSSVYPAASYAGMVSSHGGKVAVFNLDRSGGDSHADFLFLGPCEETLPEALSDHT